MGQKGPSPASRNALFSMIAGLLSIVALLIMALTFTGVLNESARDFVIPILGILIFHEGYIRYEKQKLWGMFLMLLSAGGFMVMLWRLISA